MIGKDTKMKVTINKEGANHVGGMLEQDEDVREFMGLVEWASRLAQQG